MRIRKSFPRSTLNSFEDEWFSDSPFSVQQIVSTYYVPGIKLKTKTGHRPVLRSLVRESHKCPVLKWKCVQGSNPSLLCGYMTTRVCARSWLAGLSWGLAEARGPAAQRQVPGLCLLRPKCFASCPGGGTTKQQPRAGLVVSGQLPMDWGVCTAGFQLPCLHPQAGWPWAPHLL